MTPDRPPSPNRNARERVAALRRKPVGRPPRRRSGCSPASAVIIIAFLALFGGLLFVIQRVAATLATIEQNDPRQNQSQGANNNAALPDTLRDPFNVLLIGVDQRDDPTEGVRSDTLIVVHMNPQAGWAGMLSIPRDTVATIRKLGQQKINAAYGYGYNHAEELYGANTEPAAAGGALAAETVEGLLNLKIHYIAQVDFRGFEELVNALGGVLMDVDQPLLDGQYPTSNYGYERVYIPAGLQIMDGATALRYARSRHSSSDFDRSRRQQQVLRALLQQTRRKGMLDQVTLIPDMVKTLEQNVSTTLPISSLETTQGLANFARNLKADRIIQLSINPSDVRVVSEEGSNIFWDQADIARLVARLEAGPQATAETARIQVQNGAGVPGLARQVTSTLQAQGFEMASANDAPMVYATSQLIDYTGRPQTLKRLAETLGIAANNVYTTPPLNSPAAPADADIVFVLGTDYQAQWAGP